MKNQRRKSNHCKIDPILYDFYLALNNRIGATIVHRRKRPTSTCIEIIILNESIDTYTGRLNTLKEAESCGFWVISRVQKGKHAVWHGHRVFQLFLSPVHPKKQREHQLQTASTTVQQPQITAQDVTFEPIFEKKTPSYLHICKKSCTFAANLTIRSYEKTSHIDIGAYRRNEYERSCRVAWRSLWSGAHMVAGH